MRLLTKVLEEAPDHTVAWHWVGLTMLKQNQFESARIYLENALTQNPFNPEHHIHYGDALIGQGDNLLASLHYRQALILDPDNGEAMKRMASLEISMRENDPDLSLDTLKIGSSSYNEVRRT
jgi:tetratricopeptide (TPR) repeat protein